MYSEVNLSGLYKKQVEFRDDIYKTTLTGEFVGHTIFDGTILALILVLEGELKGQIITKQLNTIKVVI